MRSRAEVDDADRLARRRPPARALPRGPDDLAQSQENLGLHDDLPADIPIQSADDPVDRSTILRR